MAVSLGISVKGSKFDIVFRIKQCISKNMEKFNKVFSKCMGLFWWLGFWVLHSWNSVCSEVRFTCGKFTRLRRFIAIHEVST